MASEEGVSLEMWIPSPIYITGLDGNISVGRFRLDLSEIVISLLRVI